MVTRRSILQAGIAGGAALFSGLPSAVLAQGTYPARAVKIIVPVSPGGLADIIARTAAERMQARSGQTFVVDYVVGAGGSVGTQAMIRAEPDGYTLSLVTETLLLVNPHLYPNIDYSFADVAPVGIVATAPLLILVPQQSPIRTLEDLISNAREAPGSLTYGSSGPGTMPHLVMHLLCKEAGIEMLHIPYGGGGASVTDLTAGRLDALAAGAALVAGSLGEGSPLRAIAVSGAERLPDFPDVPTVAESGLPGFGVSAWWGLAAPAGTPPDIVAQLNEWLSLDGSSEAELARLSEAHLDPTFIGATAMTDSLAAEAPRWERIVSELDINQG